VGYRLQNDESQFRGFASTPSPAAFDFTDARSLRERRCLMARAPRTVHG
jgi:hypothetical protein